ncbi:MAG: type II toxin-antitoxin system VapC family toxin [Acidimicrobiia bacterium]|nr:type II toxin-antitoxin system VapC family toxin [Acidimicrobiia bacterium]
MAGRFAYLDSSAFVKLVVAEPGSPALRQALARWPERVSAALLRTETARALRRSENGDYLPAARRLFRAVHLIRLDEALLDRAGDLGPSGLRTLDAIHLAAALDLGDDLGVMFTYDAHLRRAAEDCGVEVDAPA